LQKQLEELSASWRSASRQGLPELERIKKAAEAAEKRAVEAEQRAQTAEPSASVAARSAGWRPRAGRQVHLPRRRGPRGEPRRHRVEGGRERAVKKVAKARPKLVEADDPKLPGRVLENGRSPEGSGRRRKTAAES
jgi:hypothetical protein